MAIMVYCSMSDKFYRDVFQDYLSMGGNISVWLVPSELLPAKFKDLTFIDARKLYKIETIPECFPDLTPGALSRDILHAFSKTQCDFFSVIDRFSYFPKPYAQHKTFYLTLLTYALAFFKKHGEIKVFFTSSTPHDLVGIIFSQAAKYCGVKTVQVSRTLLSNKILLLESHRDFLKIEPRRDLTGKDLEDAVGNELLEAISSESKWIVRSKKINTRSNQRSGLFISALKFLFKTFKYYLTRPYKDKFYTPFATANLKFLHLTLYIENIKQMLRAARLRFYYNKLAVKEWDMKTPYVFFPLHFQPERSTQPEGDGFDNQYILASMLSRELPRGWKLIVKEHPRQNSIIPPDLRQRFARSKKFYESLKALENVLLVAQDVPSEVLIENAMATATVTGSSGWESLLKGKPAIVFGSAWYSGCDSCWHINSSQELCAALANIKKSTPEQVRVHVLQFLAGLRTKLIFSSDAYITAKAELNYNGLVKNLAKEIYAMSG